MVSILQHSQRGVRAIMAIALITVFLFTSTPPSVSHAASASVSETAAQECREVEVKLSVVSYIPPRTRGDRDFNGHGPRYNVDIKPYVSANKVWLEIDMKACEVNGDGVPKSDYTTAEGTYHRVFFSAPSGWQIQSFSVWTDKHLLTYPVVPVGMFSEHREGIDRGHQTERFQPRPNNSLVNTYTVVGDTDGDDAGVRTGVTVYFNKASVRVCPITDPYVVVCIWNRMPVTMEYETIGPDGKWTRTRVAPNNGMAHSQILESDSDPWPQFHIRYDADLDSTQYRPESQVLYSHRSATGQCASNGAQGFRFVTYDGRNVSLLNP